MTKSITLILSFVVLVAFHSVAQKQKDDSTIVYKSAKVNEISFTKIDTGNIVNDLGYSQTVAWGDFNNDLYPNIYVSNSYIKTKLS